MMNTDGIDSGQYKENEPNAGKLVTSLRSLEYNPISAVQDIIDNSIDANASNVWIKAFKRSNKSAAKGLDTIIIVDDGSGMDENTLDQALRLGSDTPKNPNWDLGLYGMGLITAAISMGKRLEVYSQTIDGEPLIGIQDLDIIVEENRFVKELRVQTADEYSFFKNWLQNQDEKDNHGTVVVISKIDRFEWATIKGFVDKLRKSVGQTFRKFIQADRCKFSINNELVDAIDPLFDQQSKILAEEEIKVDNETISLKIVELPWLGDEISKDKKFSIPTQGFYILRNHREIAAAQTLNIFTRHNSFNRFRAELSFPATLDSALNTPFSKQSVRLDQSIQDKVGKIVNPFLRQIRKNAQSRARSEKLDNEDFTEVGKFISKKAHLLKTTKAQKEKRTSKSRKNGTSKSTGSNRQPRLNITKKKRIDLDSLKVRFEYILRGEKGPLFEPDIERDVVIVSWNVEHPFYQRVVVPNANNPAVFNPIAYLIYCYANAELISQVGSDSQEIVDNIRWDVGRNLAILLK